MINWWRSGWWGGTSTVVIFGRHVPILFLEREDKRKKKTRKKRAEKVKGFLPLEGEKILHGGMLSEQNTPTSGEKSEPYQREENPPGKARRITHSKTTQKEGELIKKRHCTT